MGRSEAPSGKRYLGEVRDVPGSSKRLGPLPLGRCLLNRPLLLGCLEELARLFVVLKAEGAVADGKGVSIIQELIFGSVEDLMVEFHGLVLVHVPEENLSKTRSKAGERSWGVVSITQVMIPWE